MCHLCNSIQNARIGRRKCEPEMHAPDNTRQKHNSGGQSETTWMDHMPVRTGPDGIQSAV